MQNLEEVIAGLGTERFRGSLLGSLNSLATVDHVALIRFDPKYPARIVSSATRAGARIDGAGVQLAYENRFYRSDPNHTVWHGASGVQQPTIRRLRPRHLTDEVYRFHCFDAPRLIDRLSIIADTDRLHYCINLYRCADTGPFSEADSDAFQCCAPLIAALSVKHAQMACPKEVSGCRMERVTELSDRLCAICKGLTRRELETVARILVGMTTQGIALELGLTCNSVITYRKRAYARLGIASQNELFSLCFFG